MSLLPKISRTQYETVATYANTMPAEFNVMPNSTIELVRLNARRRLRSIKILTKGMVTPASIVSRRIVDLHFQLGELGKYKANRAGKRISES